MKKAIFNLIGLTLITIGTAYAFYQIQTNAAAQSDDPHAGHARESTQEAAHQHAEGENAERARLDEETTRDPNRLWCGEHNLYEDECAICHPEIANKKEEDHDHEGHDRAEEAEERTDSESHKTGDLHAGHDHAGGSGHIETAEGLFCATHDLPELKCGICQPQLAAQLKPGESMMVRLASVQSISKAGIEIGKPIRGTIQQDRSFLCKAAFNQNHFAHISPLAKGVIQKVFVDQGDRVEKGQVLLEIASMEIATAKSDYLKALDRERLSELTYEREKELSKKNVSAKQEFQQAEAEYQVAKTETKTAYQQLINYGLTAEDVETVRNRRSSASTLTVRAPFSGTLVEKHAALGEAVDAGESVFQIVDLSSMWLELSVPESQIASLEIGVPIQAEFTSLPGKTVEGKLTWISAQIDEDARMLKARAEVANPSETLKQGLYGRVRVANSSSVARLLVPKETVQQVDGRSFVFVRSGDDLFELRYVIPGGKTNGKIEILEGLSPDDSIVIANSFTLKSEFLKSRFGAGCAHD